MRVEVPAAEGVPESTPVLGSRTKPGGSEPVETANVYGAAPPLTVNCAGGYGTSTLASGKLGAVIENGGWTAITSTDVVAEMPLPSRTVTENEPEPTAVAIPLMTPLRGSIPSPGGSEPEVDQV